MGAQISGQEYPAAAQMDRMIGFLAALSMCRKFHVLSTGLPWCLMRIRIRHRPFSKPINRTANIRRVQIELQPISRPKISVIFW